MMTWAEQQLAEIVRIVQPRAGEDDIHYAFVISAIRGLISEDEDRYRAVIDAARADDHV